MTSDYMSLYIAAIALGMICHILGGVFESKTAQVLGYFLQGTGLFFAAYSLRMLT